MKEPRREIVDASTALWRGYLPNGDTRAPDENFPFVIGLRVCEGVLAGGDGIESPAVITAKDGIIRIVFSARAEEVSSAAIIDRLARAPMSFSEAREAARGWFTRAVADSGLRGNNAVEQRTCARAIHSLVSNACEAPGMLAGRIASFPSRGKYPTHFLWDACFEDLALDSFEERIAEDALLLLTGSLRADGKMAHFICSTWIRPHDSQPPLVGWAGLRLVKERNDLALAKELLPALRKNNAWWLAQRATRFGLISTISGLETGWDDSPRFDNGPTVSCDMNAYLIMQLRACAELARMTGDSDGASSDDGMADALSHRMIDVLYDEKENLFFDRHTASGELIRLRTPACFMPLLAGVPLREGVARSMIEDILLDPKQFYGFVPFPSVAYHEAVYDPAQWWRGPTWPPVAYLMILILDRYGYREEARAARRALYDLILNAGELRELFNSKTGEGLGSREQGWTAAIFLALGKELSGGPV